MGFRYIPFELKNPRPPRIEHFALLAGLEAAVRGSLISAMPLAVREALGSTVASSRAYFIAGLISLVWGLMVPWATRHLPRRWMYTAGCGLYLVGMSLALVGTPHSIALALVCTAMATVTCFVCFNAYVLDYIERADLGRGQSLQMLYAATPWAVGPVLGVWLHDFWRPAPFLMAAMFALCLLTAFWVLRLGNGKQISRARRPAVNPLAYLGRFFAQPRLIAGWSFAVIRSCGWWVYVVYLPIFCVESGLGDKLAGTCLSATNALLFIAPLMMRFVRRGSVRKAVRLGFVCCGLGFLLAAALSGLPLGAVVAMMGASVFLVFLDVVGSLPFLMAVKPSERAEMSAIFSSFRDVSGIVTPGAAWVILLVAPLPGVFAAAGLGLGAAYLIAGRLHARLGSPRPSHGGMAA